MSSSSQSSSQPTSQGRSPVFWVIAVLAWLWVAVPFTYGLVQLVARIPALFSG